MNDQTLQNNIDNINREFLEKETEKQAKKAGLPYIDFSKIALNSDFLSLISESQAKKAKAIPFFQVGKRVRIGISDPKNEYLKTLSDELRKDGFLINFTLISEESFKEGVKEYEKQNIKEKRVFDNKIDENALLTFEKEIQNLAEVAKKQDKINADELLNSICVGAIKTNASDIHIEPKEKNAVLRYRIDGVMQNIFELQKKVYDSLVTQIKLNCKIKLNIKDLPQDGHFSFNVSERKIDVRTASLPTEYGESFVMRVLDPMKKIMTFEDLGFSGTTLDLIQKTSESTGGLILNTGPTGSGKTTTLYAIMRKISSPLNKIVTLEDPIEYNLENVAQSQINEERGYTFSVGLRALLRQDPDIVMVGEIRDEETAKIACQAAMTGHLVLSTLHTNSAIEAIPRIINMGIKPFMLAPPLTSVIAQRLVRKPCPECSKKVDLPSSDSKFLSVNLTEIEKVIGKSISPPEKIVKTEIKGCSSCSHTGYKGRIAIIEILEIDSKIKEMILNKTPEGKIFEYARKKQRFLNFKEDGILKAIKGLTTLEEIRRITN